MAFARRTGIATALAALALAGPAQSAAAPYREYEIGFSGEASPLGKSPSEAELINAVAWIMSNKLGLPFPTGIKAYIYVNQATLVDGLIQIAGEKLAEMHLLGRAGLFAHELTHVSQRKLAEGGRGGAAQWILEGHADWVKVQVLDLLGFRPYRESRDEIVRSLSGSKMPVKFFPDLEALATNAGWTSAR